LWLRVGSVGWSWWRCKLLELLPSLAAARSLAASGLAAAETTTWLSLALPVRSSTSAVPLAFPALAALNGLHSSGGCGLRLLALLLRRLVVITGLPHLEDRPVFTVGLVGLLDVRKETAMGSRDCPCEE
jgi:hypothetical protein